MVINLAGYQFVYIYFRKKCNQGNRIYPAYWNNQSEGGTNIATFTWAGDNKGDGQTL